MQPVLGCMSIPLDAPNRMHQLAEYYIPNHVHFASEGDAVVFMDLRTDQYSLLIGEKARAFLALRSQNFGGDGRTLSLRHAPPPDSLTLQGDLIQELLDCKLITANAAENAYNSVALPLPEASLVESAVISDCAIRRRDIIRVLLSCSVAKYRLSCLGIERTIMTIRRRRELRSVTTPLPLAEAQKLVLTYNIVRPLFPRDNVCLFDSVALLEFLAHYDILPYLVFAITLDPWNAHCWIQHGTVSFNEDAERARTYLPILVA